MNFPELLDELRKMDETILLEVLEITSDDLVDSYTDRILDNVDKIYRKLNEG